MSSERQHSIDKNVSGAMMLAFYAYIDRDGKRGQESIDVVNKVMDACGYPRVPNIVSSTSPRQSLRTEGDDR